MKRHEAGARRMGDLLPRHPGGVVLRRLAVSDLRAFQAYRGDPQLARYQGWSAMSDEEATEFLLRMSQSDLLVPGVWSQIGIAQAGAEHLIGDIGLLLSLDGRSAEVGITLGRESQGRGFGAAALREAIRLVFEATKAESVHGVADARNVVSIRLLQRVGMQQLESRNAVFRDEPCIEHIFAVKRPADV